MSYEAFLRQNLGLAQEPNKQTDSELDKDEMGQPKLSSVPSNKIDIDDDTLFNAINSDWVSYLGDDSTSGVMEFLAKLNKEVRAGNVSSDEAAKVFQEQVSQITPNGAKKNDVYNSLQQYMDNLAEMDNLPKEMEEDVDAEGSGSYEPLEELEPLEQEPLIN